MKQALVVVAVLLMLLVLVADCQNTTIEEQYESLKANFTDDFVSELDKLAKNGTRYSEEKVYEVLLKVTTNSKQSCFLVDDNEIGRLLFEVLSSDKVQQASKALKRDEISSRALGAEPVRRRPKVHRGKFRVRIKRSSEDQYQLLKESLIDDVTGELYNLAKEGHKYNEEEAHEKLRDILMMATAMRAESLSPIVDENKTDMLMNEVLNSDKVQKAYKALMSNGIASRSIGAVPDKGGEKNSTEEQYHLIKANLTNDIASELINLAKRGTKYNKETAQEKLRDILMMVTANRTEYGRHVLDENQIARLMKEVLSSEEVQQAYKTIMRFEITSRAIGALPVMERQKHYRLLKANLINEVTGELNNLAKTGKKYDEEGAHMKLRDILMTVTANRTESLGQIVDENKIGRLVNEVISSDKVQKAYKTIIRDGIAQRALGKVLDRASQLKSNEEKYELIKADLINDVDSKLQDLAKSGSKYTEKEALEKLRDIFLMVTSNRAQSLGRIVDEKKIGRLMNDVLGSEKVQQAYKAIMRDEIVSIVKTVASLREDIETSCKDRPGLLMTELINDVTAKLNNLSKSGTKYPMEEGREKLRDIFMMVFANRTYSLTPIVDENEISRLMIDLFQSDKVQDAFREIIDY